MADDKADEVFIDTNDAAWLAWATKDWEKSFVPTHENTRDFPA